MHVAGRKMGKKRVMHINTADKGLSQLEQRRANATKRAEGMDENHRGLGLEAEPSSAAAPPPAEEAKADAAGLSSIMRGHKRSSGLKNRQRA